MSNREQLMSDQDEADCRQEFEDWWKVDGKRCCASLIVATENMPVKEKVYGVFREGWVAGSVVLRVLGLRVLGFTTTN